MSGVGEAFFIGLVTSFITAGLTYALTPTQKIQAGRLNDLTSSNSSYGVSLPWAWGTVRLPGNKIWLDYLEEVRKTGSQGGGLFGLAPKVETTTFNYYGYYASLFCDCPFRPIVDYQRLWMNKKLVYSIVGGAETIAQGGKFADKYLRFYKGEPAQIIDPLLQNTSPISNYNYGLPTNEADRSAYLESLGIDPNQVILTPGYNHRAYLVAQRLPLVDFFNALPADEAEIIASENCTVGQIIGDIFSLFFDSTRYDVSLLTTPVQGFTIDSVTAAKSAIQTLQQAYFFDIVDSNGIFKFIPLNHPRDVIDLSPLDLAAHSGGNQKPLDYEIIEKDPTTLPSEVVVKYIDPDLDHDVNEQRSQLDVKSHYNRNPVSLSFSLVMTASEAATIADRALILAWLSKYTYKFQLPPAYLTLEPTDLVTNVFDDGDYPVKITQTRVGANLIVDCEGVPHDTYFWDLIRILESGDLTVGVADYNVVIETNGTPNTVADTSGTTYTEGTDYTVNNDGNVEIIATGNIAEGTDLIISTTAEPTPDLVTIVSAGDTELLILDIPLIDNADDDYTLYFAAGGGSNWTGASIYFSTDNSRYLYANNIEAYSVYGNCRSDLQSDTITVEVNRQELETISNSDVALGFNLALIGDKICQFKTAQLIDVNTYELSEITTGLRGTETEADPVTGDRFVLLTGEAASLAKIIGSAADIGQTRYFKAVSSGQTLNEVTPVQITIAGNAQKPYAPVNLAASKNAVGDIIITWDRRDRHDALNTENPPLSETAEEYNITIHLDETTVRSKTEYTNSTLYTIQEQTSDFGGIQSTITVKVAQVSSSFGVGSYATATLTPVYLEPAPTIDSFTPASATIGETIALTGTNLAQLTNVTINQVEQDNLALVDNNNAVFTIAPGTESGLIQVVTTGGSATSQIPLLVQSFTSNDVLVQSNRSLVATDNNKILSCQSTQQLDLTLDPSLIYPGFQVTIRKKGTGDVFLSLAANQVLEAVGNKITQQYTAIYLTYQGSNLWIALGAFG